MEECLKELYLNEETDTQSLEEESVINVYPTADLPIPYGINEKENEIIFLDPTIGEGKRLVKDKSTPIPHLFALLRQFIAPVCRNIGTITEQMIKRGLSANDVDATTGMTMLHYAVRATALSENRGLAIVKKLLSSGGDPRQRCLYSGMNALHIAAYFDLPSVAKLLLKPCDLWRSIDVNSLCEGFNFGTSLHIACYCLSFKTVEVLLQAGAWTHIKDDLSQTAIDCLPTNLTTDNERQQADIIKNLFMKYQQDNSFSKQFISKQPFGLKIGSKVVCRVQKPAEVGDSQMMKKLGILRFVGRLPGSSEQWAGVELFSPDGQNSGDYENEVYFKCKKNHGIFVLASLVSAISDESGKKLTSFKATEQRGGSRLKLRRCKFQIGDRVLVAGKTEGTIRFVGETQFASGTWCGIELDDDGPGRNDGSVSEISYFKCSPTRGVFSPPSKLILLQSATAFQDPAEQAFPSSSDSSPRDVDSSPQENGVTSESSVAISDSSDLSLSMSSPRAQAPSDEPVMPEPEKTASNTSSVSFPSSKKEIWNSSTKVLKSRPSSRSKPFLHAGMRVGVRGMGRRATVKFIGETDFSDGLWVGLDLGSPCGKNDGSVQGRRYFTCAPRHGLMLRPHRVTYNGVSGNDLLPSHLENLRSTRD